MAYTSSGALPPNNSYPLGEYTFRLTANYDSRQNVTHVTARCTKGEETASRSLSVSGQVSSWSVEADETEASVYVTSRGSPSGVVKPIPTSTGVSFARNGAPDYHGNPTGTFYFIDGSGLMTAWGVGTNTRTVLAASPDGGTVEEHFHNPPKDDAPAQDGTLQFTLDSQYTLNGKTVYYTVNSSTTAYSVLSISPNYPSGASGDAGAIAWTMIYGDAPGEYLVARFQIDLQDAGGGAGGDWDEPGDDGDPFKILHLTVVGAHSGRHNDPMGDTSYSYLPADKLTVAGYGCGGDGGHGGGGGAGASTVIIHKFATSQADSKDLTALARGHGYGSGGGKGGKGGNGIILIYYREATP